METKISRIKKRDGSIVAFDQGKITSAIFKAAKSVGGKDKRIAQQLSDNVVKELEKLESTPSVEQIQDIVEKVLIEEGHASTAKAYILYRQERAAIRKEKQLVLEKEEIDEVDKRFDVNSLRVLKARYLRKDSTGKLTETPKELFTRVAVHAALPDLFYDTRVFDLNSKQPVNMVEDFKPVVHEDQYGIGNYKLNMYHLEALKRMYNRFNRNKQMKVAWSKFFEMVKKGDFDSYEKNIDEFYNLMTHKLFMPNTPAIANFGNPLGMGSACFHPNQPIMTENGPKDIKDIKAGDLVLTHKGRFRKVEKVYVRATDSLYQVSCNKLPKPSMLVTEEHPILSHKDNKIQWLPLNALEENDYVALSYPKETEDVKELKVSGIVKNVKVNEKDKCSYSYKGGKFNAFVHTTKPVKNTIAVDYGLMKLFGYYLSEGSIADRDCVRFTFSIDEEDYCKEVIFIMEEKFGVSARIEKTNNETKKWLSLRFHSTILASFFENILGRGYNNKHIPQWIVMLPQDKQKGLMAGLIRGDGTIFKNSNTRENQRFSVPRNFEKISRETNAKLVMCNQNVVYAFWQMTMRCGVFSALGKESMPKLGSTQPYRCTISGENGLLLINELFERQETDSGFKPNTITVDGVTFARIDKISKLDYAGPVYNLEVEEDHSYVANMVSVHNCFVLDVPDSIEGIMETLKSTAIVFKAGGGMGYNFSKLRPEGDFVSSTGGVASGPLSFMRLFDTMTEVIKQGGCVATDTMVRTDKGLVPMSDMLNSPPLRDNPTNYFVYDGQEYSYAWLAQNNGYAAVFNIETELGNSLKATGNHLTAVATENGIQWKKVDSIKAGDWLVIVLGGYQGKKMKLPKIEKQHHNSNPLKIPEFLNEELAELLGLYVSDGCFNRGRLLFSVDARDKDLLQRIKYLGKSVFGLGIGEIRDKLTYIDMVFFSKDLEKYFENLGWKKERSWNAFIPTQILQSEENVVCAFLRGVFEGDGSVHNDGYPLLYSTSKLLIEQVQQLLLSLGIVAKIYEVTKSRDRYGKRPMYKIAVLTDKSIELFKEKIGFVTENKNQRFDRYKRAKKIEYSNLIPTFPRIFWQYYKRVGRGSGKGRSTRGANIRYYRDVYHYLKNDRVLTRKKFERLLEKYEFLSHDKALMEFVDSNKFFVRVTKVSSGSEKYTMEIEVPATSSYIANGLLVHNIRRGANMGILNSNHPDIEKFITAKDGNKSLRNFNISVLIMPDFWEHYENNEPYPLINPKDGTVVKTVNPRVLFDKIVYQAWESAEPGVIFFDKVNDYNPFLEHLGPIVTTNPCVAGDTLVSTDNGLERIESMKTKSIVVDVRTETIDKNLLMLQKGCKKVEAMQVIKTGMKDVYKLVTKSGYELTATADHKVLTDNRWKKIHELTENDSVYLQSGKGNFNKNPKLPFEPNNNVIGENGRTYKLNLPKEWSRELGLLLGWLTGDGWLSEKHNSMGFVFAPEDSEIKDVIKPILENYCNRTIKENKYENGCVQVRSASKHVVDFFKKLGVSENKCLPSSLLTATEDAVIGFLQGLFAADGSIGLSRESRNYIRLNSSSIKLLKDVQLLLLNLGIRSSIYDRSTKPKEFKYTNSKGELVIYKTSGTNYELNISKENIPRFLEKIGFINTKFREKVLRLGNFEFYEEHFLDSIKTIDYVGKREVYDITESSTHSFIANGIVVHNCGEVLLYPNEPCNLGSINVWAFARQDEEGNSYVDWDALKEVTRTCTRFLDNVIDVNNFPLQSIEDMSLATRKIGLGIMGLGDLLYELRLPYNTEEGRKFMEQLMEFIEYWSKVESIELAKTRGNLPYYDKSFYKQGRLPIRGFELRDEWHFNWDKLSADIKNYGIRNGYTTIIAPTGSISMIAGCSSGMEPVYSLVYEKNVKVGSFYYVDPAAEKVLREEGLYNDKLMEDINEHKGSIQRIEYVPERIRKALVTAMDITPEEHIRALASFQKWVDSSISKTNNFPADATLEHMRDSYILAYKLGCKDVTVFRDSSIKDQVLVAPKSKEAKEEAKIEVKQEQKKMIKESESGLLFANGNDANEPRGKQLTNCPECSTKLEKKEGCLTCPSCGWGLCT